METENETPLADIAHGAVAGLDEEDGGADALLWHDYDPDIGHYDDRDDDSALIQVQLSGAVWSRCRDDGVMVIGQARDRHTMATVPLRTSDDSNRWLGFALIGTDPRDVRPDLLALVWQRNTRTLPKLIRYGRDYLRAMGHDHDTDLLNAAAADALLIVAYGRRRGDGTGRQRKGGTDTAGAQVKRHRPRRPTVREREAQFCMGHDGTYARLRDAVEAAYRKRYQEAATAFADVDNWRPTPTRRARGSGWPEGRPWQPSVTTVELSGAAAHGYHQRHPPTPPTDWINRGRLTSGFRHNELYGDDQPCRPLPIARRAA